MNFFRSSLASVAACGLLFSAAVPAFAAAPKDYQITGTVAALTDTTISIQTLKSDTWEIGRDSSTKAPDGLKVGDRVTVHYTMTAGNIEAKAAAGGKKEKTGGKKAKAAAAASSDTTASKPAAAAASPTP